MIPSTLSSLGPVPTVPVKASLTLLRPLRPHSRQASVDDGAAETNRPLRVKRAVGLCHQIETVGEDIRDLLARSLTLSI